MTTAEEYAAQQAVIANQTYQYTKGLGKFFTAPALSLPEWFRVLNLLFPQVAAARAASAANARVFFDAEREAHSLPPMPRELEGTDFPRFAQSMEPARAKMSLADSTPHATTLLAMQAVREVDNAGRRQIIHAVEDDAATLHKPDTPSAPRQIRGWARVATGRETCAWCLMLVSRGPVYQSAQNAGLDIEDAGAKAMDAAGEDVSGLMNQWHPNCDCIVVPVYKQESWPGALASKRAEGAWIRASEEADALIASGKSRTTNRNRETLNALRRSLAHGDVSAAQFSGLAAAA